MSSTLSHVEFAQAYEQWKNRGWDSSVQAFAVQINDIPNRKRIDWLLNSGAAKDRLVHLENLFSGDYDDDIELWLHPELAEPEPPVENNEPPIEDDGSVDWMDDFTEDVSYLDN